MLKYTDIALILLMLAAVTGILLLAGCTQESQPGATDSGQYGAAPSPQDAGNGAQQQSAGQAGNADSGNGIMNATGNASRGYRGMMNGSGFAGRQNLTDEQRQQMMQQRLQQMADACSGKAEGDACAISNSRGNMTGSCATLNGTLACSFGRGTGGFGNGSAPQPPQGGQTPPQ